MILDLRFILKIWIISYNLINHIFNGLFFDTHAKLHVFFFPSHSLGPTINRTPDIAQQKNSIAAWYLKFTIRCVIWVWINTYENTIFSGMNIHLPTILMWTTGVQGLDTLPCACGNATTWFEDCRLLQVDPCVKPQQCPYGLVFWVPSGKLT